MGLEVQKVCNLSPMQEGMLFHALLNRNTSAYFEQMAYELHEELNIEVFNQTLNRLIERYEILRSNFFHEGVGRPKQVVIKQRETVVQYREIYDLNGEQQTAYIHEFKQKDREQGFDLSRDLLMRVSILRTRTNTYEVIWSFHHILMDGWCLGIIINDFFMIYHSIIHNDPIRLEKVTPYSDYIKWLERQDQKAAQNYWRQYLEGYEQKAGIPKTRREAAGEPSEIRDTRFIIPGQDHQELERLANENQVTLNIIFQTIWGILLQKYNNIDDVVFGAVVSGRPAKIQGIEKMVGLFINTVPVRIQTAAFLSFGDLVKQNQANSLAGEKYSYVSLAEIQADTELKQELLDHILVFENYPVEKAIGGIEENIGFRIGKVESFEETNYDFNVIVIPGRELIVNLKYNPKCYDEELLGRIGGHFQEIVRNVINNPDIATDKIEIISETEKRQILYEFNNTTVEYPKEKTLHQLFEEQVERTPDTIAVVFEDKQLTYFELNTKANQLAWVLKEKGVKPNSTVGIMVERSLEMIIGILGIVKSGGAYLPIDPAYPAERIKYISNDSQIHILITKTAWLEKGMAPTIIDLEDQSLYTGDIINLQIPSKATDLSYIMYTSGSTGAPKGVMVTHGNVTRLVINSNFIQFQKDDRILSTGAPVFDAITFEIWGALLNGLRLYLVREEVLLDGRKLQEAISTNRITILWLTSSLFNQLSQENEDLFNGLKNLLVGGDILTPKQINRIRLIYPGLKVINGYGPTENTTFSTCFIIDRDYHVNIPIGKPINNSTAYIFDRNGFLQPLGVVGELCVGGDGVAKGYLNQPELTAARFIMNPYRPGERIYRTGDLARWLPDGNIEFLGRADHQVKIRGFRIELGEIEARLLQHETIKEAVVIAKEDHEGNKYLCAYIVVGNRHASSQKERAIHEHLLNEPASDFALNPQELRAHLLKELPEYMIPNYFLYLEKMPLTPNGKIDRRSLPDTARTLNTGVAYEAPRNELEEKLAGIWQEVLGVKKIGINDNFFELGGHSLKATILASRIFKALGMELPLREVFQRPTVMEQAEYLKEAVKNQYKTIQAAKEKEGYPAGCYPLSSAQKRLYILNKLEPEQTNYNISGITKIEGALDRHRLEAAFKGLIKRHDSLRTSFEMIDGEPVQRIHAEAGFEISYQEGAGKELKEIIQEFIKPFDLSQAPLLRVKLVKTGIGEYLLCYDMHHIITDGTSMGNLIRDFVDLYEGKELPELRIQYKDYAVWQKELLQSDVMREQEEYWLRNFVGEIPVLNLPTDYQRPLAQSFAGDVIGVAVEPALCRGIKQIAKETGATLFMILLAAYNILLSKYSSQEDIIVGSPIAGRLHADLEPLIGMFVNTLALRNHPSGAKTFKEFLREVKENALKAYENQDYQFETLVEKLNLRRDLSRSPLFDVMFVLQNMDMESRTTKDLKFSPYEIENKVSKFDLTLLAVESKDGIYLSLEYCSKLFEAETMERMSRHLQNVLQAIVSNAECKLAGIEMLSDDEKRQILYEFNDTAVEYPKNKTIHQLFEEQAARTPDNIAVVCGDRQLTYGELNKKANQLARVLREKGVKANQLAGIMVERSLEMVIGIIGVLKSGGAYLPIDPNCPEERIKYMLQDGRVTVLLTKAGARHHWRSEKDEILSEFDLDDAENYTGNYSNLEPKSNAGDLVYCIYTSGSTGNPKGVMVEHNSLVNVLTIMQKDFPLMEHDAYLLKTSYTFDVSATELFGWFFGNGKLVILESGKEKDPLSIFEVIIKYHITHINFVPSMLNTFLDVLGETEVRPIHRLKYVFAAGEALSIQTVNKFYRIFSGVELANIYGPTEATIYATRYSLTDFQGLNNVPIGKPMGNMQTYIFDTYNNLQPIGVVGELCIAGEGLARGYLNQPELTAEKFVPNPFALTGAPQGTRLQSFDELLHPSPFNLHTSKIYRTGDFARWLPDGNIEFLGRIDHQVKIRGFRIELGEIETRLMQFEAIKETVVVDKEDHNGNKYLCAYVVFVGDTHACSLPELRAHLMMELPEYMIPSFFIYLEKMPLTPNGKIDRRALPEPDGQINTGVTYEAPRNDFERKLAGIWQEVLGIAQVGVNDNFFELGGHSLKAAILVSKIHKAINRELPLREVFQQPTIRRQAEYLQGTTENHYETIPPASRLEGYPQGCYPVSSAQKRMYILHQLEADPTSYNLPGAVIIEGDIKPKRLEEIFKQLIVRHESLRTSFELIAGETVQRIKPAADFALECWQAKETEVNQIFSRFVRPFDLGQAPLLRVGLIEIGPKKRILIYDMHHIIADGTSMGILIDEFVDLYEGKELTPLRIQYKDYAGWQREQIQSGFIKEQETYWLQNLTGEIPVLNLSTDYPRPTVQTFAGNRIEFELEAELTGGLKRIAAENGATLFMVLLAAYNVILAKYSGQEDIIIGTPIAGRPHADLEQIIGMFVNTLALRNQPESRKSFREFLDEVKENALHAFENQDYQFETLVEKLNLRRDMSRNPIFDVMFVFQNIDISSKKLSDLKIVPYPMENLSAKFDLTVHATENGALLHMDIEYCAGLFKPETAARMAGHMRNILQAIVHDPRQKLAEIEITSEAEKRQILYEFNNTATAYPKNKTMQQLFEEQAERTPDQIAVNFEDGRLTYRELNTKANQLAHTLRIKGIRPNQLAAIIVHRSMEMIVGIMGILKSGGAYLPIDPGYPRKRVRYILEDSNIEIILTTQAIGTGIDTETAAMIYLDEAANYTGDRQNPEAVNQVRDIAYCIYTSGSTGAPKGVLIENQSLVNRLHWMQKEYPINLNDGILQKTPYTFDVSLWELFWWSFTGAMVTLLAKGGEKEPETIIAAIENHKITTIHFVPSMLNAFLDYVEGSNSAGRIKSLKQVFASGEALTVKQVERFHKIIGGQNQTKLHNLYGPTEATVDVSYYECSPIDDPSRTFGIPIGKPIDNIQLYIVNPDRLLQPIGVAGELCIAGDGLARGYLNRPELTAEKFVPNPFITVDASHGTRLRRMYCTGDLAKWLPDGNIEYLGRIDHQVKIRGFRIELGEIEARLLQHETVKEAIVIAKDDQDDNKFLCAYLVGDREQTAPELREYLSRTLPEYMIPSSFVFLEKMPLTTSGKIDRKALPEPEGNLNTSVTYEEPRNDMEWKLAEIWQEVLGIRRVGIGDNFFEAGGDSIKAIQVVSRLYQSGLKLSVRDVIQYPRIMELSKYIRFNHLEISQAPVEGEVLLTPIQRWFFAEHHRQSHFNQSVMLYHKEGFDPDILKEVFERIIMHHDALRMVFQFSGSDITQINRGKVKELLDMTVVKLNHEPDATSEIRTLVDRAQSSMDLSAGPLVKLMLFKTGQGDHLLIVIHHLVIDGVSWRVLFEDLGTGYEQMLQKKSVALPAKTSSFRDWARQLQSYASGKEIKNEISYWEKIEETKITPLPKDHLAKTNLRKDALTARLSFTAAETEKLLKEANWAYNTDINDLLLTALGLACKDWAMTDKVIISMEGHGREEIINGVDITRTVGWFTSLYPFIIDILSPDNLGSQIKTIKEDMRRIPNHGIGYGILKYLTPETDRNGLHFKQKPEICFNYLGQFSPQIDSKISLSDQPTGTNLSPELNRLFALEVDGMIVDSKLTLSIGYNRYEYDEATINDFTDKYRKHITRIIEHCVNQKTQELTPSDLGTNKLDIQQLDTLLNDLADLEG